MSTTAPELEVIVDDITDLMSTPPPTTVDERPSVVDLADDRDITVTYAPRDSYETGVEDTLKFVRAEMIWRRGQKITANMIEEVFMSVRLAARDSTPRSSKG